MTEEPVEDPEVEVIEEEEEDSITALEARLEALEKELQYSAAEMVNVRQRAARDRSDAIRYGGPWPMGQPQTMEAIATVPVPDGGKAGSVIEIVEVGYMYHDRILRAARVIVAEDE